VKRTHTAVALLATLLLSAPVAAQWFTYPTPGVPRTAAGTPDLNAPAPRTPDGKPDFSGIWLADNHLPCPPFLRDGNDCIEKTPLSAWAYHIDADLKEGLPYQPWAAAIAKQRFAANSKDDPHAQCLPSNPPRAYTLPHYQKVIQMPGLVVMLSEFNASYRQIFTDGRPLPVDPQPSWNGYSSGRWEGDTLVVQTNGLRDGLWLDMAGNPMTDAATITERITRPNYGTLAIAFTVNDPKAYTRPWTVQLRQSIVVDTELIDEVCLEGLKPLHLPK
jgi:hypothetical protein